MSPDPATPEEEAWDLLREQAAALGVDLSGPQLAALRRYQELLCEWNRRFNLTAITRPEEIRTRHFLDSLSVALVVDLPAASSLIDVGSGAGLPGLVLKIAFPHLRVTLLDSLRKRVGFLERAIEALDLRETRAIHARAEDAGHDPSLRGAFDVVTARAVAAANLLAEWTIPFARVGGSVVFMKGPDVDAELQAASRAIRVLGGELVAIRRLTLPGTDVGRSLVLLAKRRPTPAAYPRSPAAARRAPL